MGNGASASSGLADKAVVRNRYGALQFQSPEEFARLYERSLASEQKAAAIAEQYKWSLTECAQLRTRLDELQQAADDARAALARDTADLRQENARLSAELADVKQQRQQQQLMALASSMHSAAAQSSPPSLTSTSAELLSCLLAAAEPSSSPSLLSAPLSLHDVQPLLAFHSSSRRGSHEASTIAAPAAKAEASAATAAHAATARSIGAASTALAEESGEARTLEHGASEDISKWLDNLLPGGFAQPPKEASVSANGAAEPTLNGSSRHTLLPETVKSPES
eukprot:TRINITY_DN31173_c0_g1_i1.p1 TRINITY_DN31173_c0_g1~~TRINITY_DN31173_c0_g1_i1.p1  ORF type:complete len:281 (-),score=110.17 TRINITY_DN31173_c0_g1_i1:242-1084(-)